MTVKTTYLQMFARSERVVPPPREGLAVVHAKKPTVREHLEFELKGVKPKYMRDWENNTW